MSIVHLYSIVRQGKVYIQAKWPLSPELIPVSAA